MLAFAQGPGSYYYVSLLGCIFMFKTPWAGKLEGREVRRRIQVPNLPGTPNEEPPQQGLCQLRHSEGHTFCVSHSFHEALPTRQRDKVRRAGWELGSLRFHPSSAPKDSLPPPLPQFSPVLSEKMALGDPEGPPNLSC